MQVAPRKPSFRLDTLGLRVLELFAMYATDGRSDGRTDGWTETTHIAPFPTGGDLTL